ncbi:MAG: hypothetical protein Q9220_003316 [cf. Caloplaca sp. 1 TL-2023]
MSSAQRQQEILAKKAKLEELRRQREERSQRDFPNRAPTNEASEEIAPVPSSRITNSQNFDKYIDGLIGDKRSSLASTTRTSSPLTRKGRLSSTTDGVRKDDQTAEEPLASKQQAQTASVATQTLSTAPLSVNYEFLPTQTPAPEIISYSKAIQTTDLGSPPGHKARSRGGLSDTDSDHSQSLPRSPRKLKRRSRKEREHEEELRQHLKREVEEELKAASNSVNGTASKGNRHPARPLTDEELNVVTGSNDFLHFVEKSSKVIERALDQDYNVLADYGLDSVTGRDSDDDDVYGPTKGKKGRRVRQVAQFYDERWSKKRMISDIGFSPKYPELLLASYTKNPSAPTDPAGLLQVWNMHLHSRPEYTFHATSDLLTAQFSPFHPSILIGGTYSGQILLWDTRSRSVLPSQKTPLTGAATGGHTHPIYSIALVGTQNANNIISCSTDGAVCGWTTDMLSQPQEYLTLTAPPPSKIEDLSPLCMAFPPSDPTSFLVGTEEGTIYPCHRYDRAGAAAGIDNRLRYRGHTAPVMSLNFHPARGPVDFSDLFLSTGIDWSIRLWKSRPASSASNTGISDAAETVEALLTLPREDTVYDAKFSPLKPGVFAAVDGAGMLEIWDLATDTEVPVAAVKPEAGAKAALGGGGGAFLGNAARSLSKVAWEEKEGKRLAVGGAAGVVSVFEVGGKLSGEGGVKGEEWNKVKRMVARMGRR